VAIPIVHFLEKIYVHHDEHQVAVVHFSNVTAASALVVSQNLDEMCILKDELESKEHSLRWHGLELQRKNLELQQISFTDPLTGVWNRRYLEEILTAEAGQVLRNYQRARGGDIRTGRDRDCH